METSYKNDIGIAHSGIKGMHWGVRRYQNYDGSLTSAGQKRYGVKGSVFSKTPTQKVAEARAKEERSANKARISAESEQASVQSIIRKASAKSVKKNLDKISDKDLQDYLKRKQMESQLDTYVKNESIGNKTLDKIKNVGNAFGTVYNTANNIRNAVALAKTIRSDISSYREKSGSKSSSSSNNKSDSSNESPLFATLDDVTAAMNTAKSESKKYADDIIKDSKDSYADSVFKKVDEQFSKKSEELDKKFMNEKTDWMKKVDMEALSDQMARQNDKDEVKRWVHNNYLKKPFQDDGL